MRISRCGKYSRTTHGNQFDTPFSFGDFNADTYIKRGVGIVLFSSTRAIFVKVVNTLLERVCIGPAVIMKQGLEIGGIAVDDVVNYTAFHYEAVQPPTMSKPKSDGKTLLEHYADVLIERQELLLQSSDLLVFDLYFSKYSFVDRILDKSTFKLISRLRDNAVMYYLYKGSPPGKRGRPQLYDGKIAPHNPNQHYLPVCHQDSEIKIFSAEVYVKSLGRKSDRRCGQNSYRPLFR